MFAKWKGRKAPADGANNNISTDVSVDEKDTYRPKKWNLGILSDRETDEVPGKSPGRARAKQRC